MNFLPLRFYNYEPKTMDSAHNLVSLENLPWPCYNVHVFYGAGKKATAENVPRKKLFEAIQRLRGEHKDAGVIGVTQVGDDRFESELIAKFSERL